VACGDCRGESFRNAEQTVLEEDTDISELSLYP
jgi:hypothetical protein